MNRITKKKITSVAMAVTLTVLAPIKLNSENKIDKASVFAGENTKIVLEEKEGGKTIRLDCGNGTFLNSKFQNQGIQLVPATNNNEKQKMHMPEINKDNSGKKTTIQRLENGEVITLTEEPAQGFPTMENKNNTDGKIELKKDIIKQELKINIPEKNDEKVHDICKPLEDLRRQLEDHKNKKINEKLEEKKNTKTYEEQRQEWLKKINDTNKKIEEEKKKNKKCNEEINNSYKEYNKVFREYDEWKSKNEPSTSGINGITDINNLKSLEGDYRTRTIVEKINGQTITLTEEPANPFPSMENRGSDESKVELKKNLIETEEKINIPGNGNKKENSICEEIELMLIKQRKEKERNNVKKPNEESKTKNSMSNYEKQIQEWLRKIDEEQIKAEKTKDYGEYNKLFREYFEWKKINEPKENRKTSNPSLSGKSEIGKLGSLEGETKNPGIAGGINKGSLSGSEGENNNLPILGISGKTDIKRLKGLEGDNEVQKIKDKKENELKKVKKSAKEYIENLSDLTETSKNLAKKDIDKAKNIAEIKDIAEKANLMNKKKAEKKLKELVNIEEQKAEKEYEKRRKERERIETEQGKERERQKELEDLDKKRAENESKEKEQEEQMKRDEERQNKEIEKVNHRVELSKEKAENIHRIIGDFNESINNLKDLNNNWVCFSQEIVNEIEIYKNYGEKASKELDKILAENKEDKNIRTLLDRVESSGNRLSQIFENIRCEVYAKTGFYIEYRY